MIEFVRARIIRREDDVVAVRVLYRAAICRRRKITVGPRNQHWEIGLIRIGNSRMVNNDCPHVAIGAHGARR